MIVGKEGRNTQDTGKIQKEAIEEENVIMNLEAKVIEIGDLTAIKTFRKFPQKWRK